MPQILIYCSNQDFQSALEKDFKHHGYTYETTLRLDSVVEHVIEIRPNVLILRLNGEGDGCEDIVATIRQKSSETKIIYAPCSPSKNDVKSLEHGVFYYAGDASPSEIVLATVAALKRNIRKN